MVRIVSAKILLKSGILQTNSLQVENSGGLKGTADTWLSLQQTNIKLGANQALA
jgi:hypothetical protein